MVTDGRGNQLLLGQQVWLRATVKMIRACGGGDPDCLLELAGTYKAKVTGKGRHIGSKRVTVPASAVVGEQVRLKVRGKRPTARAG